MKTSFRRFPQIRLVVLIAFGRPIQAARLPAQTPQTRPAQFFPYRYHSGILKNGLRVILVPMPSEGLVSYWSIVRTGSRDEIEPGRTGYAHFFEHMMFRGTKKYPGPVYDRLINNLGAHSNAFTSEDLTAFHITLVKDNLPKAIEMEADRFQNLEYDLLAFQTEAGAVYGEYRKDQTEPPFLLEERLRDTAFDKHTYKHTTMGFESDVKSMPQGFEYSLSFFKRFYRPENVVLLVVGDFDERAAVQLIRKHYITWQPGYTPPAIEPEPEQTKERRLDVAYPGRTQPILDLAYHGDAFDPANRDYVAGQLLADLAFGETSDVYRKLVLDQQKAEYVSASMPMSRDPGLFEVTASVHKEEDLPAVQSELENAIAEFQTHPVDEKRLARVARHARYDFLMQLDTPDKTAQSLAPYISVTGAIQAVDAFYATADTITPADIQHAANKYFVKEHRTVAVLKGSAK